MNRRKNGDYIKQKTYMFLKAVRKSLCEKSICLMRTGPEKGVLVTSVGVQPQEWARNLCRTL